MDRIPFWFSLGVGTPASEPSPRNRGLSSVLESWAASRIVKGLTRTATVIEEAPSEEAMMELGVCYSRQVAMLRGRGRDNWRLPAVGKGRWCWRCRICRKSLTMKDEECVELKVYGVRDGVFSESLLDAISFVDTWACCPLLVAPSNRYSVAISLQMPWQPISHHTLPI